MFGRVFHVSGFFPIRIRTQEKSLIRFRTKGPVSETLIASVVDPKLFIPDPDPAESDRADK